MKILDSTSKYLKIIVEYIFVQKNMFWYHTNCKRNEIGTNDSCRLCPTLADHCVPAKGDAGRPRQTSADHVCRTKATHKGHRWCWLTTVCKPKEMLEGHTDVGWLLCRPKAMAQATLDVAWSVFAGQGQCGQSMSDDDLSMCSSHGQWMQSTI